MHVKVTETQRGPSVLLSYSFIYRGEQEEDQHGEDVVVNNLVQISSRGVSSDKFMFFISHRKLSKDEKDEEVLLRVTCENPPFDQQWISTEHESDWLIIGAVENCTIIEKGTSYSFMNNVQININARKIEKPGLCSQMFLDADFVDFSLSAVDGSVAVHKIVMASHSDVFKAMLNGEWKEDIEGRVEVRGTTRQCLGHLKDYMYLDILPDEGLCPLLLLASYYMIGNLKTRCIGKLADSVRSDNLYELLDFACANNIPELTYEILHNTPSEVVDKAYKSRKETKTQKPKSTNN